MSKVCNICGKRPMTGSRISHAHNVNKRRFNPNLQRVKVIQNGQRKHIRVCTQCIKSDRVEKVA